MQVAWTGPNPRCPRVGLVVTGFDHPHPKKRLDRVTLEAPPGGGHWMVAGVTLCDKPVWMPPDPVSGGIPDNWGAAAVVYALVEGLVGVRDDATAYHLATLAPRWSAAGIRRATATVTYPASGGYVAYEYRLDSRRKRISLTCTGSGERLQCHVLLPPKTRRVKSVTSGRLDVPFEVTQLESSKYVDFEVDHAAPRKVVIEYA
jgi:hypothetical protein